MGRLDGKIALVTGAGSGLGRAISLEFISQGAHVFVSDRDQALAKHVADGATKSGGDATWVEMDVSDPGQVAAALKLVKDGFGRLDVLVNNAGITHRADLRHLGDEQWREIVDVNLHGTVRLSRDAFDLLKAGKGPSIINLSSIMERRHIRQLGPYSTTKAAIAALSRSMAVEYAAFGIRVNYLCPGYVETALTDRVLRNPAIRKALLMQTPMGRFAEPEEIAKAALFLASDESSYITGSGLTVDGGMSVSL